MKRATHIAAIAILGLSGLAIAGPDDKQSDQPDEKQALRGPRVEQGDKQQAEDRPRRGDAARERVQQRPGGKRGEMRSMLAAMRVLNQGEGELAVTDEQREQIKEIVDEQRAAMKAYMDEHREEIEAIKAEAKAQHAEGERPDPETRKAAMEKVMKIMEGAPADGEAKKKIMGVLSEGQQALVKETMAKQRKRMEGRQDRVKKRREQRGGEEGEQAQKRQRRGADGQEGRKAREGKREKRERPAPMDD